jgi:hypothetical protein
MERKHSKHSSEGAATVPSQEENGRIEAAGAKEG